MLVLTRETEQDIFIDIPEGCRATRIVVRCVEIRRGQKSMQQCRARIGVECGTHITVNRREVAERIEAERKAGAV